MNQGAKRKQSRRGKGRNREVGARLESQYGQPNDSNSEPGCLAKAAKRRKNAAHGASRGYLIPDVPLVVMDSVHLEEAHQFLLKRTLPVMFLLVCDVSGYGRNIRFANAKHSISRLPGEIGIPLATYPTGRVRFNNAGHLRRRLRGTNPHQHMNVVNRSIDDKRRALHFADDPSEVSEKIITKSRSNQGQTGFSAEDQMADDVSRRMSQVSLLAKGHYPESVPLRSYRHPLLFVTTSPPP